MALMSMAETTCAKESRHFRIPLGNAKLLSRRRARSFIDSELTAGRRLADPQRTICTANAAGGADSKDPIVLVSPMCWTKLGVGYQIGTSEALRPHTDNVVHEHQAGAFSIPPMLDHLLVHQESLCQTRWKDKRQ